MKDYSKIFKTTLKQTLRLFKITVKVLPSNDLKYAAYIDENDSSMVRYNPDAFKRKDFAIICALHEAGHIVNINLCHEPETLYTRKQLIWSEYKAELFAVRMLKRYDKNLYLRYLKYVVADCLDNMTWKKRYPVHALAMKKILQLEAN